MKKKILLVAAACVCVAITASGTMAYFTSEDTAHNVITSGSVNIAVVETMLDGTELKAFPEEGITGVMPGSTVSKIVSIRNTGRSDAWIRVRVSIEVKDGEGLPLDTGVVGFTVEGPWFNGEDGYYYYSEAVPAERETQVLFREVRFDPDMGNEYQNCTAYIKIEAEAVQTANNPIPDGGTVRDVAGWPGAEGVV